MRNFSAARDNAGLGVRLRRLVGHANAPVAAAVPTEVHPMKWLKTTVPALLITAQACSGGGFSAKDAGSAGTGGQPGGGTSTGASGSSQSGKAGSPAKGGSDSNDGGAPSAGEGGSSASGKGGAASAGKGGVASSGNGGSSAGGKGGSASAGAAGAGGSGPLSGGCTAGGTDPCVRQALEWALGDDNGKKGVLTFKQPLLAGSTVLVFAADMNINKATPDSPIGSGTPDPIIVTDSGNGTYKLLLTVLDDRDWDDVQVFARSNLPAGTLTETVTWETNQWHAMMIVEVANVAANPSFKVAGILNPGADETTDAATSGPLDLAATPTIVVGMGINFTDKKGDVGAPLAGTGFTAHLAGWNWQGKEGTTLNNSALLSSAYYTSPGKVAVTYTPTKTINYKDNIMVLGVGIQ